MLLILPDLVSVDAVLVADDGSTPSPLPPLLSDLPPSPSLPGFLPPLAPFLLLVLALGWEEVGGG